MTSTRYERWRLVLGKEAEQGLRDLRDRMGDAGAGAGGGILNEEQARMDVALDVVYNRGDNPPEQGGYDKHRYREGPRGRGAGMTKLQVATWLGDIRNHFPTDVVALVQKDAIERTGLKQLLFEPELLEQVEPSLDMVSTILELKHLVPERAKDAARAMVAAVVEEIKRRLAQKVAQAIRGALNRGQHTPLASLPNMDWHRTIRRNLKNYDRERRRIIPDQFHFFARQQRRKMHNIIIAMDQSGSMANSLIYGGLMGSILASIPAVETHVVAFNHEKAVDLTEHCSDPVDLLFGIQLGGAEDYFMAANFCQKFISNPRRTIYILLADLYDTSPNEAKFVRKMEQWVADGVKPIGLLAISDRGVPEYNHDLARKLTNLGMPCFGCTPDRLPDLLEATLKGKDLARLEGSWREDQRRK
jgi:hypothetical protein